MAALQASTTPLQVITGDICSPTFRHGFMCIVSYTNAIACKNFGLVKCIAETYPYGNVAGLRYSNDRGISQRSNRGVEGTAIVDMPADHHNLPTIATLITQYGIGKPFESNEISEKVAKYTKDADHATRLQSDTRLNRIKKFDDCLLNLRSDLGSAEYKDIKVILIPVGIGCGGVMNIDWVDYYLPLIDNFSRSVEAINKKVLLIINNSHKEKLEESRRAANALDRIPVYKENMSAILGEDVCK